MTREKRLVCEWRREKARVEGARLYPSSDVWEEVEKRVEERVSLRVEKEGRNGDGSTSYCNGCFVSARNVKIIETVFQGENSYIARNA